MKYQEKINIRKCDISDKLLEDMGYICIHTHTYIYTYIHTHMHDRKHLWPFNHIQKNLKLIGTALNCRLCGNILWLEGRGC